MNLKDLYISFFESKGHKQIPSAPVVPENDPSVLFNTAGMQPLIPYLMGQKHPYGTRLCDYQKCIRTNDLENIGDTYHHTFFEMLGNWSLGDYFKKEAISWSFEFLTEVLHIPVEKLAVTVFAGNDIIPKDTESIEIWKSLGISEDRICETSDDNFWIAGETGPCGPDSEMFYWRSEDEVPQKFDPEDERWVEIWNDVFMQYNKKEDKTVVELPHKNVDTGMGVERTTAILEGVNDNYMSSIWKDVIELIEHISNLKYEGHEKSMRIIADHMRTAVFILADNAGIKPSNTDQGYILRRLIRRAIRHAKKLNIDINSNFEEEIASVYQRTEYFDRYCDGCPISDNNGVVSIEFGPYILLWNRSGDEVGIETVNKEFKGVYKEIPSRVYYNFSEKWQLTDDSAVPSGSVIADGSTLNIIPKSAILLNHISEPMNNSDWRVSTINGKSVSEISFISTEKIEEVTVKAVGGIPENAERVTILLMIYNDGKVVSVKKAETDLYDGIYNYSINLSEEHLYMKKDRTLKVFVYDNTENMSEVLPKIELPRTNK